MRLVVSAILLIGLIFLSLYSCRPDRQDIVNPPGGGTGSSNPGGSGGSAGTTTNTVCTDCNWQCEINGVFYSGTMDTSFYTIKNTGTIDTIVECTGTALNKKANIYLRLVINRYNYTQPISAMLGRGTLVFDTGSTHLIRTNYQLDDNVVFQLDSFSLNRMKISFQGKVRGASSYNLTNGKFTCEFGKGTQEPKFFSFSTDTTRLNGYWNEAIFTSNSLVLQGSPFGGIAGQKYKMIIHTGASIRPGIYDTNREQCILSVVYPSLIFYYICESVGNMQVSIDSVIGNIVKARFTGSLFNGRPVSGYFTARVKNYQPYTDSVNKWSYIDENMATEEAAIYGGNILQAVKSVSSGPNPLYKLEVKAESDQQFASFKIAISSRTPIDTGLYSTNFVFQPPYDRYLDSLYFKSPAATVMNHAIHSSQDIFCHIDSITPTRVVGKFWRSLPGTGIFKQGRFKANF